MSLFMEFAERLGATGMNLLFGILSDAATWKIHSFMIWT